MVRLIILIIASSLIGCASENKQHTDKSLEEIKTAILENEKDNYFCLGFLEAKSFLEAKIFKHFENYNVFPADL